MENKRITLPEIQAQYDEFIDSCAKFNFYTRSLAIQEQKITECERFLLVIKAYKSQAAKGQDEVAANLFFHFQCMINAMTCSLRVWVALKSQNYHAAWCRLIDAEEYVEVALRGRDYPGIRNLELHLKSMEASLFPGWALYNSPGHTETIGDCSICRAPFVECSHIENEIYMGSLCRRINRVVVEAHHSALVKNPKDRRCILTKISGDNRKMRDYFTWEDLDEVKDDDGMYVEGVLMSFHSLDLN